MDDDIKGFYDYPDMVSADPTKAQAEYEDRDIRIVRFKLGPGETMPMHRHPGRIDIMVTDVNALTVQRDGTRRESHSKAGEEGYSDPVVHEGHNIGDEPWEMIEIEFKQRAPEGYRTGWRPQKLAATAALALDAVPLSFAKDIRPMFRDIDVEHMKPLGFDLSSYDDVKNKAVQIYGTVSDGSMPPPPDMPWSDAWQARFESWIQQGCPH